MTQSTRKHLVIPDCQVKDGVPMEHLEWIGMYIVDKKPDVIINIGDFADMPSLSSYDRGTKSFEGRRYKKDIEATKAGMNLLLGPIREYNERARRNKDKQYRPRMVLTLGNHEHRINRAVEADPKLDGTISIDDLCYEQSGWEQYDFLQPVTIDGVVYAHYLASGVMGRPITTAQAMVNKVHQSAVVGHQQGRQIAFGKRADGSEFTCIIAGSAYLHNEDFLGHQGNKHWRGIIMLHEVHDGNFDESMISLNFLRQKYGN